MNPQVLDAFALAITGGSASPAFPGISGHEPDMQAARKDMEGTNRAMHALQRLVPHAGSYVSERDFFTQNWQRAFWGHNYPRLPALKKRFDPEGLFFVHHGASSENWSADGFTRLT